MSLTEQAYEAAHIRALGATIRYAVEPIVRRQNPLRLAVASERHLAEAHLRREVARVRRELGWSE